MREKLEKQALEWLRSHVLAPAGWILERATSQELDPTGDKSLRWDWVVDARARADSEVDVRFLVEVADRLTPRAAIELFARMRSSSNQGTPLLCAVALSPRLVELCEEYGISYLDSVGNCRIATSGFYIERRGLGKARREEPVIDLFATKASRIVRAMLSRPTYGWQVQRLARWESVDVSLGLASKVKHALLEQGFAVERDRLLFLRNPNDLLRTWARNYRPKCDEIPLYVSGDPRQAEMAIVEWCRSHGIRYALTQLAGAWRAAPAVRYQRSTIYIDGADQVAWNNLAKFGNAKRVESGANVVLRLTYDPAVFLGERDLGDPPLKTVSALQLYLDLHQLQGRGEEAAQAVYDAELAESFAATPSAIP